MVDASLSPLGEISSRLLQSHIALPPVHSIPQLDSQSGQHLAQLEAGGSATCGGKGWEHSSFPGAVVVVGFLVWELFFPFWLLVMFIKLTNL